MLINLNYFFKCCLLLYSSSFILSHKLEVIRDYYEKFIRNPLFQKLLEHARAAAREEAEEECEKWRHLVDVKNAETQKFKRELDNLLQVRLLYLSNR